MKKCVDIAHEKSISSWLSALPIQKHSYVLHKWAFIDKICSVMGGDQLISPLYNCVCGKPFTVEHSLSCSFDGFRHNKLHDVAADLLSQVSSNVQVEPPLQPLSGKTLSHCTSNADDHARLDVSARGFWNTSHEQAFVDVRVFIRVILSKKRMRMKRNKHMMNVSEMSSMAPSHLLFFCC